MATYFLPGKICKQKSLAGYSPWDCRESHTAEHTHTGSDIAESTHTQSWTQLNTHRHTHEKMCDLQKTSLMTGARETCFFLFLWPPADSSPAAASLSFGLFFFPTHLPNMNPAFREFTIQHEKKSWGLFLSRTE